MTSEYDFKAVKTVDVKRPATRHGRVKSFIRWMSTTVRSNHVANKAMIAAACYKVE